MRKFLEVMKRKKLHNLGKKFISIFMRKPCRKSINGKAEETQNKIRMDLNFFFLRMEIGWNWLMMAPSGGV
jgi:hypothetical protein